MGIRGHNSHLFSKYFENSTSIRGSGLADQYQQEGTWSHSVVIYGVSGAAGNGGWGGGGNQQQLGGSASDGNFCHMLNLTTTFLFRKAVFLLAPQVL